MYHRSSEMLPKKMFPRHRKKSGLSCRTCSMKLRKQKKYVRITSWAAWPCMARSATVCRGWLKTLAC